MSASPLIAAAAASGAARGYDELEVLRACRITDFKVERLLGVGSYGHVFLVTCLHARHPAPSKQYALKAMLNWRNDRSSKVGRDLSAEVELYKGLDAHANVVRFWCNLHDYLPAGIHSYYGDTPELLREVYKNEHGVVNENPKLLYSLFDAYPMTLLEFVRREGAGKPESPFVTAFAHYGFKMIPPAMFCHIAKDIFQGIMHLEAKGIVHRDVKLDNLMISWDGRIVLIDLGQAVDSVSVRSCGCVVVCRTHCDTSVCSLCTARQHA